MIGPQQMDGPRNSMVHASIGARFLNFTNFDVQIWPPPLKTDPTVFADYALNPSLFASLLLIYHATTSVALQIRNIRDYQGRRDTVWYRFCLSHLFVIECFVLHVLLIYQKHCSLSDNIALVIYISCGLLVQSFGA